MENIHATCVAIDGTGVLIRGPSGSGKSDLALRLIDDGAALVADDRTELAAEDGRLMARAPAQLTGKLEVRGLGIVDMAAHGPAPVALIVDLVEAGNGVVRIPGPETAALAGVAVAVVHVNPFEASAAAKVRAALALARPGAGEL